MRHANREMRAGGYKRHCPTCGTEHFPRTDPVAIMLTVTREKCLLGRGRHFAPGMYSALAGFIEPGETIEAAVRRETLEEAGIRLGRVVYHASQPWPFPYSLMIGCFGEPLNEDIQADLNELEDCRWFFRDEVRLMLARTHPGQSVHAAERRDRPSPHPRLGRQRVDPREIHCRKQEQMIRHTVVFTLKHPQARSRKSGSSSDAKRILSAIKGVTHFEQLRQVSPKNDYHFGFSMEFADQAAYTSYNDHPDHVAFVRDRWIPEVEAFLEIDYVPLALLSSVLVSSDLPLLARIRWRG